MGKTDAAAEAERPSEKRGGHAVATQPLLAAGALAAVCRAAADMLLVGFVPAPEKYPLLARTAVLGRRARHVLCGTVSGRRFRRVPADAAGQGGGVLFCAVVCGLRAFAAGTCGFLLSGYVGADAAECRACRPCAAAGAVCRFLPYARRPLVGFCGLRGGGISDSAGADPARANPPAVRRRVVQSAACRAGGRVVVQPVPAFTGGGGGWRRNL